MTPDDTTHPMQSLAAGMLMVERKNAGLPHAREDLTPDEVEAKRLFLILVSEYLTARAAVGGPDEHLTATAAAERLEFAEMSRHLKAAAVPGSLEEASFLIARDASVRMFQDYVLRRLEAERNLVRISADAA